MKPWRVSINNFSEKDTPFVGLFIIMSEAFSLNDREFGQNLVIFSFFLVWTTPFFYISNRSISNQGSELKILSNF